MSEKKPTILVTGVGAIIGYGILRSLRQSKRDVRLIGMDIYDDAYGRHMVDKFIRTERADSPNYLDFITEAIKENKVDLIIPGIEQDLYMLHKHKEALYPLVKIVMNNDLCIELSKNKLDTYRFFKDKLLQLIPTLFDTSFDTCAKELSVPFLIKPISGYASKGINKILTEDEFVFYTKRLEGRCIYQRIVGSIESEYTISVFGDGKGSLFDSIILKRQLSQEGATSKAVLIENEVNIMSYVSAICNLTKPLGPTNIQIRIESGLPYLLEINPRISSACSIRTIMGYNEPSMCIDYFLFNKYPTVQPKRRASVVRYIDDYVIYE
ncbi:MAG: ATP-grasp domain-containing protein [Bacteroidota bacterium]